jgi:RNA polymerase sigma factor (sigma-70 family)
VASVGRERADDCFQETVLAALRAYPRLEHGSNLKSWLLTIASRKAIDEHRAAAKRPELLEDDSPVEERGPKGDGADAVFDRVRSLPSKQRSALILRFVADLPHAEIGRVLDCSADAARRNVHEGLEKLRAEEGLVANG